MNRISMSDTQQLSNRAQTLGERQSMRLAAQRAPSWITVHAGRIWLTPDSTRQAASADEVIRNGESYWLPAGTGAVVEGWPTAVIERRPAAARSTPRVWAPAGVKPAAASLAMLTTAVIAALVLVAFGDPVAAGVPAAQASPALIEASRDDVSCPVPLPDGGQCPLPSAEPLRFAQHPQGAVTAR